MKYRMSSLVGRAFELNLGSKQHSRWPKVKVIWTTSGLNANEIGQVCAAAVTHRTRHADKGDPDQFYVSKDLQRLGVMHQGRQLTEMDIPQALRRGTEAHLADAIQIARTSTNQKTSCPHAGYLHADIG